MATPAAQAGIVLVSLASIVSLVSLAYVVKSPATLSYAKIAALLFWLVNGVFLAQIIMHIHAMGGLGTAPFDAMTYVNFSYYTSLGGIFLIVGAFYELVAIDFHERGPFWNTGWNIVPHINSGPLGPPPPGWRPPSWTSSRSAPPLMEGQGSALL